MPTLTMTISKAALKLIQAGEAVLSSGGVRDMAGQFIELAKPVAKVGPDLLNSESGFIRCEPCIIARKQRSVSLYSKKLE